MRLEHLELFFKNISNYSAIGFRPNKSLLTGN
jgi:hypothetical protein